MVQIASVLRTVWPLIPLPCLLHLKNLLNEIWMREVNPAVFGKGDWRLEPLGKKNQVT